MNLVPAGASVVGIGAATPLGFSSAMTAASVRANLSRFQESLWVDKAGEPIKVSIADYLDPKMRAADRLLELGWLSFQEAMTPLLNKQFDTQRLDIPVLVGCARPRPGFDHDATAALAGRLTERLKNPHVRLSVRLVPSGHPGALIAVAEATAMISAGTCDFVFVGGVDSYYHIDTLEWLDGAGRLQSEENPDGFVPGEASAFALLASHAAAVRFALPVMATVLSAVVTSEPHPYIAEGVCIGQGLTEAIRESLKMPTLGEKVADWTICDLNGESFRAMEWVYAYLRTGPRHRDPLEIWHPADCYGDVGAASGCVLLSIAMAAWQRKYSPGSRCLVWSSSDGPERGAVLMQRSGESRS